MSILITGTPGVGKTTVAKEIARRLGLTYISVAELAFKEGLVLERDKEHEAYIIDEGSVRKKLRELAGERSLVIDTHIASTVPPDIVEIAVVLRLDPREVERRLEKRGYPRHKILENVQAEILDACLIEAVEAFGEEKVFEVDASGKSIEQVVEEVLRTILDKRGAKPGSVNWLEKLGERAHSYLMHKSTNNIK